MSPLAALVLLQALFAFVHCRPSISISSLKVEQAVNKTLCPFIVEFDVNEDRIPSHIKEIKCVENPEKPCCERSHKCTQLIDRLNVTSKDKTKDWVEVVNVGCVCMKILEGELPKAPSPDFGKSQPSS